MTDHPAHTPKEVAWNGVRFQVPAAWEISRMGRHYLQLEDDRGPVFELKWQPVRGRFSPDDFLKRVAARRWRRMGVQAAACDLPDGWPAALGRFCVRAFQWQGPNISGQGAILYCSHCQTAHLLQFLRRDIIGHRALCVRILASFRDHPSPGENGNIRWTVYDLRADIPDAFTLRQYRFVAGAFALTFDGPHRSALSLLRWGPASLVLKQDTLRQFITRQLCRTGDLMPRGMIQGDDYLHLDGAYAFNPWGQWFRRLRRRPLYRWLHAWHDENHNRILAVDAHGMVPLPRRMLEQVCDHYVMV